MDVYFFLSINLSIIYVVKLGIFHKPYFRSICHNYLLKDQVFDFEILNHILDVFYLSYDRHIRLFFNYILSYFMILFNLSIILLCQNLKKIHYFSLQIFKDIPTPRYFLVNPRTYISWVCQLPEFFGCSNTLKLLNVSPSKYFDVLNNGPIQTRRRLPLGFRPISWRTPVVSNPSTLANVPFLTEMEISF